MCKIAHLAIIYLILTRLRPVGGFLLALKNKTDRREISEILLKVVLNAIVMTL